MIQKLALELVKRDYESLCTFVENLTFEQALKELDGFNLNVSISTINNIYIDNDVFFDCNYKAISTTIFRTEDGKCEVYENCELWLDDYSTPIGKFTF